MFDIGFIEIMIVSIVALIVVGPERLPHVARTIGHLLGRLRRYVNSVKNDIQNEIRLDELKKMHTSINDTAKEIESSVQQEINQIKSLAETNGITSSTTTAPTEDSTEYSHTDKTGSSQTQIAKPQQQGNNATKNDNDE